MISIEENINSCIEAMKKLTQQRNDITQELYRLEGSHRTLTDMKKMGVSIIETKEVLDVDATIRTGSSGTPEESPEV